MSTQPSVVRFPGGTGEPLTGRLHQPAGQPRAVALFAHCFTCTKDLPIAARLARRLTEHGLSVLRFDFTGLGESEGDFATTSFSSNVEDLVAAAAYLERTHGAPALLIGHSLGGAAVLRAASRIPACRAVVTLGAPAYPGRIRQLLSDAEAEIEAQGSAEVRLGPRTFRITRQLLDDLGRHDDLDHVAQLKRALLVMHAPLDQVFSIDNASEIFVAARHPKSFVSLDSANHLLTRKGDAEYAADTLAAWAGRYLPKAPAEPVDPTIPEGVTQAVLGPEGYATDLFTAGHRLRADEPVHEGGTDTGPSPYGYLLSALGSCTLMTLRMYAQRKGWPLAGASCQLRHGRVHAKDCEECDSEHGMVDVITRELQLEGPLDASQRDRLLQIADRCPVHRTLTNEIRIRTRMEPESHDSGEP